MSINGSNRLHRDWAMRISAVPEWYEFDWVAGVGPPGAHRNLAPEVLGEAPSPPRLIPNLDKLTLE